MKRGRNYKSLVALGCIILVSTLGKSLAQRCFEGQIRPSSAASAHDCVNPDFVATQRTEMGGGDPHSTGDLDDFCLRTEISDDGTTPKVYEGVGKLNESDRANFSHLKNFPILEKLVQGRTWSYQADGRLTIANMNWQNIKANYDRQFKAGVQDLIDRAAETRADVARRAEIREKFMVPVNMVAQKQADIDVYQRSINSIFSCLSCSGRFCFSPCQFQPPHHNVAFYQQEIEKDGRRKAFYETGIERGQPSLLANMTLNADGFIARAENYSQALLPLKILLKNIERFPTPDFQAQNPYFVEVTGIKIDNEILKNYLHIRVFMNRSVSDRRSRLHTKDERHDKAYGRMKAFILMVKDQEGWPVGDFSYAIPCSKTCTKYGSHVFTHDTRNDLPCSYTPPTATTHPGLFVWPSEDQDKPEGMREIHATWSFAQDSCNFVTELHFQTLIVEDFVERPGTDFFATPADPDIGRPHFFGWTARYNVLHPTKNSTGAPDFVSIKELRELNKRSDNIDCHVPLSDSDGFIKGQVPSGRDIPTHSAYFLQLLAEFQTNTTPNVHYFGQHLNGRLRCRIPVLKQAVLPAQPALDDFFRVPVVSEFAKTPGIRCPCPALPTTPGPDDESATPDPSRLHGRLLHGSHMTLAWMVLVPLAFFVARFYKETFSTVFCFQEYWWWMWHVGLMLAATAFVMGGILSVSTRKNVSSFSFSTLLILHNILGAFSIILFYIQIFTGFFRAADPEKRVTGIFVHWLVGTFNQVSAISCVIMMGFVKQSGMTCNALIVSGVWVIFYLGMFGIMEFNLRVSDRKLKLNPPRSYLPPPVMRLFGQDAPGRIFRIVMLGIFILGLICIYLVLINFIWSSEGMSCQDEWGESFDESAIDEAAYSYEEEDS